MSNKSRLYGKRDNEEKKPKVFLNSTSSNYHIINQDEKNLVVPTLEYVKKLEQSITLLSSKIETLERKIRELHGINSKIKHYVNKHDNKITVMENEIDNKIDRS
jgi:SMC interacting uncharacterized protein involved in chromosome segregation